MSNNNYTIPQLKYIRDLTNVISFIKTNKKSPSVRTDDNTELLLAKDLARLRDAHHGGRLPKECYDLATSNGNIDLFTTLATNELIGLTNIIQGFSFNAFYFFVIAYRNTCYLFKLIGKILYTTVSHHKSNFA